MFDLIVIGAGPAGSAAAITAAAGGARVLLLEKGRFPRHKVCGEFVSAESLGVLESLLGSHRLLQEAPRIFLTRLFVGNKEIEAPLDPPGASVTRFDLDWALWRAAEAKGVETRSESTVLEIQGVGPFVVRADNDQFEARAVINATGRWSNLSHGSLSSAQNGWIGLKAHFAVPEPSNSVDLYFFDNGYCGVQPVSLNGSSESVVNVCAMVRAEDATTVDDVFQLHAGLKDRSRRWRRCTPIVATAPLIFSDPSPIRNGIPQIGDAAGFVDPFIGDGISLALRSGVMAANALAAFLQDGKSLTAWCEEYDTHYRRELLPIHRNASRLRWIVNSPAFMRLPLFSLMAYPAVARYVIGKSRGKVA